MKKAWLLSLPIVVLLLIVLWIRFAHQPARHAPTVDKASSANGPGEQGKSVVGTDAIPLSGLLESRCKAEGVVFEKVGSMWDEPLIPAAFADESGDSWDKFLGKLEARYGMVPIYKNPRGPSQTPSSIKQVGRFIYMGNDPAEIRALQSLAWGDEIERSDALDFFDENSAHALPLFVALQSSDPDAQVRIEATQKLQAFPESSRAIESTVGALGDEDEAVRAAARATLVWIGDERVLRALRVATRNPDAVVAEMATSILQENLER